MPQKHKNLTDPGATLFPLLMEHLVDGILVIDHKGTVSLANSTARRMFREKTDDLVGLNLGIPAALTPVELVLPSKNGETYVEMRATEITWAGQTAFLASLRDISDRKKAELEKENLQAQLFQARKLESIGRLAGGVAHEFNNMMGVILGYTELALDRVPEHHVLHTDLKEIEKAARRSADLTKKLLTFARKQIISPRVVNLNQIVTQTTTLLKRLVGMDIDLVWQPGNDLWPVKIDPSQVQQILVEVCTNARDAITGAGKIVIETDMKTLDDRFCSTHTDAVPGDFVVLAVSDNGCGMDPETRKMIFEPFYTTKDMDKGVGLGLATIYGIVRQNNGVIHVSSKTGRGTTVTIYLPREVAS